MEIKELAGWEIGDRDFWQSPGIFDGLIAAFSISLAPVFLVS